MVEGRGPQRNNLVEAIADVLIFRALLPLHEGKWDAPYMTILKSLEREVERFISLVPKVESLNPGLAKTIWNELGTKSMEIHQLYAELDQRVKEAERHHA